MRAEAQARLNVSLWRAFLLQIALISATAIAGVFLAEFAIRELLIESALTREADYFWSRRNIERTTPAPNTNTLIGYVFERDSPGLPDEFEGLGVGIHDIVTAPGEAVVHVSANGDARLYLVFDANNMMELATYFGVAPLALMLVILYSSAWAAYVMARRAVSPVIRLARTVRAIDLDAPGAAALVAEEKSVGGNNAEIEVLSQALQNLLVRVDRLVERERLFTREASHELRSPLTVIRMASDTLLRRHEFAPAARSLLEKIRRSAQDMEELTDMLLLLARDNQGVLMKERVAVNEVLAREISACRDLFESKQLQIEIAPGNDLFVHCSARMLSMVLGNLLRNACSYTDHGRVTISTGDGCIRVRDEGIGIGEEQLQKVFMPYANRDHARGNGIGLSLVKRITDRLGWEVTIDSSPGRGTTVVLRIPEAMAASAPSASAAQSAA